MICDSPKISISYKIIILTKQDKELNIIYRCRWKFNTIYIFIIKNRTRAKHQNQLDYIKVKFDNTFEINEI